MNLPFLPIPDRNTAKGSIQKQRGATGMQGTQQQKRSDCTMLFVDRGFPIDVIFYASVWERRERRGEERGERTHWLLTRCFSKAAIGHQIPSDQIGSQATDAWDPHLRQASPSPKPEPSSGGAGREAARVGSRPDSTFSPTHSWEGKNVSLVFVWLWGKLRCTPAGGVQTLRIGGAAERVGNQQFRAIRRSAWQAQSRVWVPTWDVEVARRLLVGAGGRLAV